VGKCGVSSLTAKQELSFKKFIKIKFGIVQDAEKLKLDNKQPALKHIAPPTMYDIGKGKKNIFSPEAKKRISEKFGLKPVKVNPTRTNSVAVPCPRKKRE
jgi:hypothetical protein